MNSSRFPLSRALLCAVVLVPALACVPPSTTGGVATQSGSLAFSRDGKQLFVVDNDNDQLLVVDPTRKEVQKRIAVGHEPARVVVGQDGRVFVSNTQSHSVSVIDTSAGLETQRIDVGTEPTGLALTADGATLLVANRTNATVSIIDVPTLAVRKTVKTLDDPSNVTVLPDGRVYVTHVRSPNITVLQSGTFEPAPSPMPLSVPLSTAIVSGPRQAGQPAPPVVGSNGRVYIPHSESDVSPIVTAPTGTMPTPDPNGGSAYAGGGDGFIVHPPVVAPAIATVDTRTDTVLASEDTFKVAGSAIVPPTILTVSQQALSGPSAAVIDPGGQFLFVVHLNSNNVAILPLAQIASPTSNTDVALPVAPAGGGNVSMIVGVGAGPTGIAIAPDGNSAYVYNSFDHSISVLRGSPGKSVQQVDRFSVGSSPLTPEQDLGRRLFFSAADARMTSVAAGGIACASCHPGGREDGRTWQFTEGPRNTPTLAGRHLGSTAPYHWDGALAGMHDFNTVIANRMGGVGDGSTTNNAGAKIAPLTDTDFNAMLAYLDSLSPPANPFRAKADPAAVARGEDLFKNKAACASCHTDAEHDFTDNGFHDVGTMAWGETFPGGGVNTPTLHNLFATAPYLHDGSKATLLDRVRDDAYGTHGKTSGLSEQELQDLVTYLQTL